MSSPWTPLGLDPGALCYFKRYRMEINLDALPAPALPPGFEWIAWHDSLLETHSRALFGSFDQELDTKVFPSLSTAAGCYLLMSEIRRKPGFLPDATWMIANGAGPCGTVQGIRERSGCGAIQNLGVAPRYRGMGLGEALLLQSLHGFRNAGLGRAMLEVTAENDAAIRLYRRVGFLRRKTLYKAVVRACAFQEPV
jgi:ribosomal protein S18 acetylase RimI-like enzyme